jgi:hypothetical protein
LEIGDVKELLAPELRETKAKRKSEINKASRQGMTMVFAGFVVILILAILRDFVAIPKSLFAVAVLIFIIGGAIRMSMPTLFGGNNLIKSSDDLPEKGLETDKLSGGELFDKALPEGENRPPMNIGARGYDTNELVEPASVTEHTTRQLEKELPLK